MATLKEIQNTELEILSFFADFCERQNIRYTMIGGTMLGAVRHHGFIPWDDDVDVYMRLEDAGRLEKCFQSDHYFLQTPKSDPEMPYIFYKIRKSGTKMEGGQEAGLNIHKGVWIDLFFYTSAARSKLGRKIQMTALQALQSFQCRFYHAVNHPQRAFHVMLTRVPNCLCLLVNKFLLAVIKLAGSSKSEDYFTMDVVEPFFQKKAFLDHLAKYSFEDKEFWGIKDCDGFLRSYYGDDYMTPKQWGHFSDYSHVII